MPDFVSGELLLLDKPAFWTSFDLVNKVKFTIIKKLNIKKLKVGHAGTLDPLATGLMIICTGRATKMIDQYKDLKKEYLARIQFGATTPSFDLETEINNYFSYSHITNDMLMNEIQGFIGITNQVPPMFSAKFVNGKRAYEYARKGKELNLEPKKIEIEDIKIVKNEFPVVELKIVCSKGTYIRSIARDLGEKLKSGAHLIGLKRTAIGQFKIEDALSINELENLVNSL